MKHARGPMRHGREAATAPQAAWDLLPVVCVVRQHHTQRARWHWRFSPFAVSRPHTTHAVALPAVDPARRRTAAAVSPAPVPASGGGARSASLSGGQPSGTWCMLYGIHWWRTGPAGTTLSLQRTFSPSAARQPSWHTALHLLHWYARPTARIRPLHTLQHVGRRNAAGSRSCSSKKQPPSSAVVVVVVSSVALISSGVSPSDEPSDDRSLPFSLIVFVVNNQSIPRLCS